MKKGGRRPEPRIAHLATYPQLDEAGELYLTVKEYAARFGLHVQTVYSAIRHGHRLYGSVIRSSPRSIRIAVPRESIQGLTHA